ncbi:MAG: MaoC family dehydratase N-terminal domain-containing protein [Sporichthyaceae bacterium]
MPLDPGLVGRTYPPSRPYEVGREKIREFAEAIGDTSPAYIDPSAARALGHGDVIAPPTFPIVFSLSAAIEAVIADPDVPIEMARVVHGTQQFTYSRPLRPGDRVVTTVSITGARTMAGSDLLTVACSSATEAGEHVVTSTSMLVGRAAEEA